MCFTAGSWYYCGPGISEPANPTPPQLDNDQMVNKTYLLTLHKYTSIKDKFEMRTQAVSDIVGYNS